MSRKSRSFWAFALVVPLVSLLSPPANAGPDCTGGTICGWVKNIGSSDRTLWVTNEWGCYIEGACASYLYPGYSSSEIGIKDADGYKLPTNCTWYLFNPLWNDGAGGYARIDSSQYGVWHKIYNGESRYFQARC